MEVISLVGEIICQLVQGRQTQRVFWVFVNRNDERQLWGKRLVPLGKAAHTLVFQSLEDAQSCRLCADPYRGRWEAIPLTESMLHEHIMRYGGDQLYAPDVEVVGFDIVGADEHVAGMPALLERVNVRAYGTTRPRPTIV